MASNPEINLWRLLKEEPGFPPLLRSHTFEQFVVRPCNSYALEAAKLITVRHGKPELALFPNCLFLHGKPGAGKTHLMVAAAQAIEHNHPETRIKFGCALEFVWSEFRGGQGGDDHLMRDRYECVDVLLLENIEGLRHLRHSRQWLDSFINWFLISGKTLVLTSGFSPSQLEWAKTGSPSWFETSLVAEVHPLDHVGRAVVMRQWLKQTDQWGRLFIPEEVIAFLADQEVHDFRELHGLLVRALMEGQLANRPLTIKELGTVLHVHRNLPCQG